MALLCHQFYQMRHLFRLMQQNQRQRNLAKPKNVARIIVCLSWILITS
jgi:hypothetical protein